MFELFDRKTWLELYHDDGLAALVSTLCLMAIFFLPALFFSKTFSFNTAFKETGQNAAQLQETDGTAAGPEV
jgi:hypothetical protein